MRWIVAATLGVFLAIALIVCGGHEQMATQILRPIATITPIWNPSPPVTPPGANYKNIDEETPNDSDILISTAYGDIETTQVSPPSDMTGTVSSVSITVRARRGPPGSGTIGVNFVDGLFDPSDEQYIVVSSTSFSDTTLTFTPPGGGSWDWTDLDDPHITLQLVAGATGIRVSQLYMTVVNIPVLEVVSETSTVTRTLTATSTVFRSLAESSTATRTLAEDSTATRTQANASTVTREINE